MLVIEKPTGTLNGVHLALYIRVGTDTGVEVLSPAPRDYLDEVGQAILASKLNAADDVFVDVIVVVKQPATLVASFKVRGTLTIGGSKKVLEQTINLEAGSTATVGALAWWVVV
jgi:hypothetical protein